MKALLALALFSILGASQAFAGTHVCIVTYTNLAIHDAVYNHYGQIYISCEGKNPETRTITLKKAEAEVSKVNIATVLADLIDKGYTLAGHTDESWILTQKQ
jgi:hypothetical protein